MAGRELRLGAPRKGYECDVPANNKYGVLNSTNVRYLFVRSTRFSGAVSLHLPFFSFNRPPEGGTTNLKLGGGNK